MEKGRTLVIGDIHGGFRALIQVLARCEFSYQKDKLIFLGDYVDGWSESAELIQYLIELDVMCERKPIFIKGNHDVFCGDWLSKGHRTDGWIENGGQATLDSYIRTGLLISDAHRIFFGNLLPFYVDKKNRVFVHGGFISKKGIGYDIHESDYYWDRDLWNLAMIVHCNKNIQLNSKNSRFYRHKEIYIGHTSTTGWRVKRHFPEYHDKNQPKNSKIMIPMNRCNVWNLDTGGGWEGRLTVMDIKTKEYWQSDIVDFLYPEESGRKGTKTYNPEK